MNLYRPVFNWSRLALLIFSALLIYGCRKEFQQDNEGINDTSVLSAKEWYEEVYPAKTINKSVMGGALNSDIELSQLIQPDWHKALSYKRFNSDVVELPIASPGKFRSILGHGANKRAYGQKENSKSSFVILNKNGKYEAFVMTLVADSAYLAGDRNKLNQNTYNKRDPKYSGLVLYFSPKGRYLGGWRYKNGELITAAAKNASADTKAQNAANYKPAANEQAYCEDWWWITENEDGEITSVTYLYTICYYPGGTGGGADAPPPPPKCPGTSSVSGKAVAGNTPWEPGPTQPGDDGGFPPPPGSAGDGCAVQGNQPPVDTAQADTLIDPCAQASKIKNILLDAVISGQRDLLLAKLATSSFNEWGGEQNLKTWPGDTYKTIDMREGTALKINSNVKTVKQFITWNKSDGFTIGLIHSHPLHDQPSAADVFSLLDPLKNSDLINGGVSAINYYKNNFSVTVIIDDATYVMKIADFAKLQTLQQEYAKNDVAFNKKVSDAILNKLDYDAGFLSIFGDAVVLYKAGARDTQLNLAKLDSDGKLILINPCK